MGSTTGVSSLDSSRLEAGATLMAERPFEALTLDAVVDAAGVAKGTFYYHFQSLEELAAAVGEKLGESFDELLAPVRLGLRIPLRASPSPSPDSWRRRSRTRLGAALLRRAGSDRVCRSVRAHLKTDLGEAWAQGALDRTDVELAADIVVGIWLQVTRGTLQRRAAPDLVGRALDAVLRALVHPRNSSFAIQPSPGNPRRTSPC